MTYLFLCRFARMRFLYLCFDIFFARFFLIVPTCFLLCSSPVPDAVSGDNLVQ